MKRLVTNLTIYLLAHFSSRAQEISKPDHDTTYYRSFKGTIIGRVYLSRNYMQFKLDPAAGIPEMSYRANKPLSLGVGITYRSFSFSFSKGLNFLQSNKRKGATRSTDLQLHLYKRKWTIDALAQFYRGYYLNPRGLGTIEKIEPLVRPVLDELLQLGLDATLQRIAHGPTSRITFPA